ncbi:MAG TPA: hypothetical protein VMB71_09315 [Acetobacteraceae bacterium]|nr:hypothetical protein [Acetobacteraceae bacterium]
MSLPVALIVITPFLNYAIGDEITGADLIESILSGPYADDVVKLGAGGNQDPALTVVVVTAYAGTPVNLGGYAYNYAPSALDYSIDSGTTWTAVANFVLNNGAWTGTGPTFASPQTANIIVRDHTTVTIVSQPCYFYVTTSSGGSGDGTITLADGSEIDGLGLGLQVTPGSGAPGVLSLIFGNIPGTVADGGGLAEALTEIAGLLPSSGGTMTGDLAFAGTNPVSTISAANTLVLAVEHQLWLGGTDASGAVYSATIAGQSSNPGTIAVNKLWNNGGALALARADGLLPLPTYQANFVASQPWGDVPASAAIFPHAPLPSPPVPLAGMLIGDRIKLGGDYNFAEVFAPQQNFDAWPTLQNFLLYAQLMYRAQKGAALDNVALRDFVDVKLPAGDFLVSQPLIVPENVRLGGPGRILRAAYTGNQSNDGVTSLPGPFATNAYLPTVVVAPHGHLGDLNVYVNTDGQLAHRGSGVCLGKNWAALVGAACTIGAGGTGYSAGDLVVPFNPSPAAYWPWVAQVTAVNDSGAITAAQVYEAGAYALPPASGLYNGAASLQAQQWTTANGFSVFDPAHAGCFLQDKAFRSDFTTPSPGTGATLAPGWAPDYTPGSAAGTYNIGSAITCGMQCGRIQITGGVPAIYSADDGPTFCVMITGLEFEIDSIQGIGGNGGVFGMFAQDVRIGRWNIVEAAAPIFLHGCGSWHCAEIVLDTCGSIGQIDQSHGCNLYGRAFWEPGNLTITSPLINTQTASDGNHYALLIGSASTAAFPCAGLDIRFTVQDMGGLPASTIALYSTYPLGGYTPSQQAASCFVQYLFNSRIDLCVSNISQYGGTPSLLPTSGIYRLGFGVDPGNDLRGTIDTVPTIDGVAPPAQLVSPTSGHGFPGCAIRVWDGLHQAWLGPYNTVEMFGSSAPTNGTSGTGAGLAMPGSAYIDTASGAGHRYVNTGTQASPNWS